MAREIELKYHIIDHHSFENHLKSLGISLSEAVEQNDIIFFRKGKKFDDLPNGEPVIRIRQENGKAKTTIKKYINGSINREEVECEILDVNSFKHILSLMDYQPIVAVQKIRSTGVYDGATIAVDHVKKLGFFAEIEIISSKKNFEDDLNKIMLIAQTLGLNNSEIQSKPYDEMLYLKGEKYD